MPCTSLSHVIFMLQDVGGEERPLADALLPLLGLLVPNEPELQHLTGMPTATEQQVRFTQ
jgi:sugar/nucleoside kinase (ribokinase family)